MRVLLEAKFADQFIACAESAIADGVIDDIEIVSGFRDVREQTSLYHRFRLGRTALPVAQPGKSYHNYGLAVDVSVTPEDALEAFGAYAEECGLRWGGHFGDPVHFDAGRKITIGRARRAFKKNALVEVV